MMDRKSPVLLFVASPLKESAFLPSQVLWHLTALIKHVPEPDKMSFWWVIQAPGGSLANFNPRLIPDAEVPVCLEPVSGFIEYL